MREDEDPKKPQPVRGTKKHTSTMESAEAIPWCAVKVLERDRHRHV